MKLASIRYEGRDTVAAEVDGGRLVELLCAWHFRANSVTAAMAVMARPGAMMQATPLSSR